jgi:hypothetical protein
MSPSTDESRNYIRNGGTAGTMVDWTQLLIPAASVRSVNGKTGTLVLTLVDLGAALAAPPAMTLAAANALIGVLDFQVVAITDLSAGRERCWYDATVWPAARSGVASLTGASQTDGPRAVHFDHPWPAGVVGAHGIRLWMSAAAAAAAGA